MKSEKQIKKSRIKHSKAFEDARFALTTKTLDAIANAPIDLKSRLEILGYKVREK